MHISVVYWSLFIFYWCTGYQAIAEHVLENDDDNRSGRSDPSVHPSPSSQKSSYTMLSEAMSQAVNHETSSSEACHDDISCITMASQDRLILEAIRTLHKQLDDDDNGNVDLSESDDFLREELKYDSGYERRQKAFHYNDDTHISVRELWEAWLRSEVHNWTVEQTSEWLAQNVELPQYVNTFIQHRVTGATLPRLAVNNMHYVSNVLGIKDPIHKQKIALKAMDVVLFGPPKDSGNRWKDLTLVTLVLSVIIGCWYAYQQNKSAKKHLQRMAKDMEGLHKAEIALEDLQKELELARLEQENVATEKLKLERRLMEAPTLPTSFSDLEVQQLKQEIEMLRVELSRAEGELEDRCWAPPAGLQAWLQMTHELENKSHMKKRLNAEKQLQQAREACEKLRKKRSSLVGAFVSTHGKSIDEVDRTIVEARNALGEVTNDLQERVHRWKQIESLCGFNIVNNNGLSYLEGILYRNGSTKGLRGRISSSQDDLDDDSSVCAGQALMDSLGWHEESSGSDEVDGICTDTTRSGAGSTQSVQPNAPVQFTVGASDSGIWTGDDQQLASAPQAGTKSSNNALVSSGSLASLTGRPPQVKMTKKNSLSPLPKTVSVEHIKTRTVPQPPPRRSASNYSMGAMVRSHSTDLGPLAESATGLTSSDVSLESVTSATGKSLATSFLDEETYSTDSSIVDDELKRRRRKLHFTFNKKNKTKPA